MPALGRMMAVKRQDILPLLSFPLCGNGLSKPLDSGLRRNDEMRVVPPLSFQRRLESRKAEPGYQKDAGFGQDDGG